MTTLFAALAPATRMHHATRAKAARLDSALTSEWPGLTLGCELNEDESSVLAWVVTHASGEEVWNDSKLPDLADVLDLCQEMGLDAEEAEEAEEEDRPSSNIVAAKYRKRYEAESSTGQTCGDWLAEQLVADTINGFDGKLVVDALVAVFSNNGLDLTAKWAVQLNSGARGAIGRFRMSGRIVLEKHVALRGVYIDANGGAITPRADWLAAARTRHAKWVAKNTPKT